MYKIEFGVFFSNFQHININLMHFKIYLQQFFKTYCFSKILIFKYFFKKYFIQYYFRIRNFKPNSQMMFMRIKIGNYSGFLKF